MNTGEVSKLTGVSVRTLQHYDKKGLVNPKRNSENDYREFSEDDLDRLQQILFLKECGFSLDKIKLLLDSPNFNREEAFNLQQKYLEYEKKRIEKMLTTLNKSIRSMKGEIKMSNKEKFGGFDMTNNPYEEEARKLWGDATIDKSNEFVNSLSKDEQNNISKGMDDLFVEISKIKDEAPASKVTQDAMDKLFKHFNNSFGHVYTLEAFKGLGEMYVADERFTKNIDKYGKGLSEFLSKAMKIYAEK